MLNKKVLKIILFIITLIIKGLTEDEAIKRVSEKTHTPLNEVKRTYKRYRKTVWLCCDFYSINIDIYSNLNYNILKNIRRKSICQNYQIFRLTR